MPAKKQRKESVSEEEEDMDEEMDDYDSEDEEPFHGFFPEGGVFKATDDSLPQTPTVKPETCQKARHFSENIQTEWDGFYEDEFCRDLQDYFPQLETPQVQSFEMESMTVEPDQRMLLNPMFISNASVLKRRQNCEYI